MDWGTNIENFSDPTACFTASDLFIRTGDSVYFENCSKIYDRVTWDFGDGSTSNEINPRHVFKSKGIYTTTLTAIHRKVKRQLTQQIYCGMQVSAEVTFNFSNWNIPASYSGKPYTITIHSTLYKKNSGAINPFTVYNQVNCGFYQVDPFKMTFSLLDENAEYQVKMELAGGYSNPNVPDGYFTEDLGTYYTDFVGVHGTLKSAGSSAIKFATLNYSTVVTIN